VKNSPQIKYNEEGKKNKGELPQTDNQTAIRYQRLRLK